MPAYTWVFLGGGLGAVARYALGLWIVRRTGADFPIHTLVINVTGGLAIGAVLVLLTARPGLDPSWRLFLVVGLLGGYTTFSAFSAETVILITAGEWARAAFYVGASNTLSLAACAAGAALARLVVH